MIKVACEECLAEFPRRETLTVQKRNLCESCAQQAIDHQGSDLSQGDIVRNQDPTVCAWCNADGGDSHHRELASLPICEPCEARLRNWPYPTWIKTSFVALAILGIASIFFNLRHVEGFFASRAAARAMMTSDLPRAVELSKRATEKVPEFAEYRFVAKLIESISLVSEDKPEQALPILRDLSLEAPQDPLITALTKSAEIAVAFNQKDYDRFLELAKQLKAGSPNDRTFAFQVASALACKYADKGDEQFKDEALKELNALGQDASAEETEYRQRIQYRIATKRIIDQKQFAAEFPNGWKQEE